MTLSCFAYLYDDAVFYTCQDVVFTPPFVELLTTDVGDNMKKLRDAGVQFPFGELRPLVRGAWHTFVETLINIRHPANIYMLASIFSTLLSRTQYASLSWPMVRPPRIRYAARMW